MQVGGYIRGEYEGSEGGKVSQRCSGILNWMRIIGLILRSATSYLCISGQAT